MDQKKEWPQRKRMRLKNYDYSKPGAYFITICTENRRKILSRIVGADVPPTRQHEEMSQFVSTFKRFCNKEYGGNIWQRSFHDHIIRDRRDYEEISQYIHENPAKWQDDCFYTEE